MASEKLKDGLYVVFLFAAIVSMGFAFSDRLKKPQGCSCGCKKKNN